MDEITWKGTSGVHIGDYICCSGDRGEGVGLASYMLRKKRVKEIGSAEGRGLGAGWRTSISSRLNIQKWPDPFKTLKISFRFFFF